MRAAVGVIVFPINPVSPLTRMKKTANSPNDDSLHITAGRKKEGMAILWNKRFDQFIIPHKYDYDWVVSIEILSDNKKMYIFNVYLPYDKLDNEEEYIDRLGKLHNILAECDSTCVAVVGEYNANVLKNANFAVLLKEYCSQFKYKWSSALSYRKELIRMLVMLG